MLTKIVGYQQPTCLCVKCSTSCFSHAVLSLIGILSLDWNLWPFLGIWGFFREFRNCAEMCKMNYFSLFWKSYFVLFLTFIIPLRFHGALLVQEAWVQGVQAHAQVLIWWKSWKNPLKSGQNLWKPSQNPWKSEKTPENMSRNVAQNDMKSLFEGHFFMEFFSSKIGEFGQKSFATAKMCLLLHLCAAPPQI